MSMHNKLDMAILGGGISGISLALTVDGSHLFESGPTLGGFIRSVVDGPWTFDFGPHIMFSKNQKVLEIMISSLQGNVHQSRRNNLCFVASAMTKYPIENDLVALPLAIRASCLKSMIRERIAQIEENPYNLSQWFIRNFGNELTELYFRPYNEKLWESSLEELSMLWSERIPLPPLDDVIDGSLGIPSDGYLHQLYYHYPQKGGYEALAQAWVQKLQAERWSPNHRASRIDQYGESLLISFTNGTQIEADSICSTIPLTDLVKISSFATPEVVRASERLKTLPLRTHTFGVAGSDSLRASAVYVPDRKIPFHRVSFPSTFSPHNSPPNHFLIQVEVTYPSETLISDLPPGALERDQIFRNLKEIGIVTDHTLVRHWVHDADKAYVVYGSSYIEDIKLLTEFFQSFRIHLLGRFGAHQYLNVDGCIEMSCNLASHLGVSDPVSKLENIFSE